MLVTQIDRENIVGAIRAAELRTSGELFCVIAHASGQYRMIPLGWAAMAALLLPLPLVFAAQWSAPVIYAIQLAVFAVVLMLLSRERVRYFIVPRRAQHERAHAEAQRQFLAHGMQNTEGRTGVLIYASFAERYAEIVADAGINEKVPQDVWDGAVAALVAGLREGRAGDGFVAAIEQCGAVLAQHFPPGAINRDELPNKLVEI